MTDRRADAKRRIVALLERADSDTLWEVQGAISNICVLMMEMLEKL